ncbi:pyrin and HIN domain-containing protein 1-like isoform X1 [Tupaia chinensis]|uniref:pyrin and HIN domain-containing protein 1-like isoform X1 n=1 Tax=Tupaia chinensis TaxID=246437 RepID=UPI0003C8E620|nr:pyrin and HIN domain-containing protein 1-like isoform X1 [Tupaia chinensis]XP_006168924.1 pyrin and HIN domain-containing protein 1-like isoform X1 [Tupaia chinensis]XP_014439790.1 pyrin and HIN domain-containing protein 1-like isoform X1 [Tupaia chinensis]
MVSEYKKIVLLKGLEVLSDYQFRTIKSLLARDLKLSRKMQEEYNRIQIADLLEEKFRGDAGVDQLIELFKDMETLKHLAKSLQKAKSNVRRKCKVKDTTKRKSNQDEPSTAKSTSTINRALECEPIKDTPVLKKKKTETIKTANSKRMTLTQEQSQLSEPSAASTQQTEGCPQTSSLAPPISPSSSLAKKGKNSTCQKAVSKKMVLSQEPSQLLETSGTSIDTTESCPPPSPMPTPILSSGSAMKKPRLKNVPKEASEEVGYQSGPKEVMVLKVTEPLTYEFNGEKRTMFHATVATESEFFHVKVFNISLKEKFIPKKIISLSDYVGRNGFLEIYNLSSVSDVNPDQKMEISRRLIRNANATPKINHLYSQTEEKFVNGVFMVHKKNVRDQCTYYEIQDSTGRMEVVVYGRLTKTHCEEGDKIKLTCFELAFSVDRMQLRSVIHSDMKVIKARKNKKHSLNPDSNMETSLESSF